MLPIPRRSVLACLLFCSAYGVQAKPKPSEDFPEPSTYEYLFYHGARTIDLIRTSGAMPQFLHQQSYAEVPLKRIAIDLPNVTLALGIQPHDKLARHLLAVAHERNQNLQVVSILAPFEAKYTSSLIEKSSVAIIPARDNVGLSSEDIDHGVALVESALAQGNAFVYLHCKSGIGRSATILTAFLVKVGGLSLEEAMSLTKELRPHCGIQRESNCHNIALHRWLEEKVGKKTSN